MGQLTWNYQKQIRKIRPKKKGRQTHRLVVQMPFWESMLKANTKIIQWKLGLLDYNAARRKQRQGFTYLSAPIQIKPFKLHKEDRDWKR